MKSHGYIEAFCLHVAWDVRPSLLFPEADKADAGKGQNLRILNQLSNLEACYRVFTHLVSLNVVLVQYMRVEWVPL